MTSSRLKVILGGFQIKAFVASPKEYVVVGIVSNGMEFGLLGTNETGRYFRINGSNIVALEPIQVEHAIAAAKIRAQEKLRTKLPTIFPTVVIRKRRSIANPNPGDPGPCQEHLHDESATRCQCNNQSVTAFTPKKTQITHVHI